MPFAKFPVIALGGLLAACASSTDEQAVAACPPVQIAVPSDRIGHRTQADELTFIATMQQLTSSCRQNEGFIDVDVSFVVTAEHGPALSEGPLSLNYFLATVDPNRQIIDKQTLDLEIDIDLDRQASALRETVTLRLPASIEASGANYNLYLGFQPDQQP